MGKTAIYALSRTAAHQARRNFVYDVFYNKQPEIKHFKVSAEGKEKEKILKK